MGRHSFSIEIEKIPEQQMARSYHSNTCLKKNWLPLLSARQSWLNSWQHVWQNSKSNGKETTAIVISHRLLTVLKNPPYQKWTQAKRKIFWRATGPFRELPVFFTSAWPRNPSCCGVLCGTDLSSPSVDSIRGECGSKELPCWITFRKRLREPVRSLAEPATWPLSARTE